MKGVFKVNKVSVNVSVVAPKTTTLFPCSYKGVSYEEYFIAIRDNKNETVEDRRAAEGVHTLIKWAEACCGTMTDAYLEKIDILNFSFLFDSLKNASEFVNHAREIILRSQECFGPRKQIEDLEHYRNSIRE